MPRFCYKSSCQLCCPDMIICPQTTCGSTLEGSTPACEISSIAQNQWKVAQVAAPSASDSSASTVMVVWLNPADTCACHTTRIQGPIQQRTTRTSCHCCSQVRNHQRPQAQHIRMLVQAAESTITCSTRQASGAPPSSLSRCLTTLPSAAAICKQRRRCLSGRAFRHTAPCGRSMCQQGGTHTASWWWFVSPGRGL